MYRRDYRDVMGGGLLVLLGLAVAIHASANQDLGTVFHLGPGMFPAWLGGLLAIIGAVIAGVGWFRPGERISPDYRQLVAIVLGLMAFGFTIGAFGIVPAVVVLTCLAVLADDKLGIVSALVLAAVLSVIAVVVFRFILAIPLQAFKWPF